MCLTLLTPSQLWQLAVSENGRAQYSAQSRPCTRSRSTKLWRGKNCREPRLGLDDLDDQQSESQDAPQNAGQAGAGVAIGRLRRFRLRLGGDWGDA